MPQTPSPLFSQWTGKALILLGTFLILLGLALLYKDRFPFLKLLGKLPGDILIEKENFKFYFPLTTSLLLSFFLTLLFWIFRK